MPLGLPFAPTARQTDHIAEVVETTTTEFLAQCLDPQSLDFAQMPPFGSWVQAVDEVSGNTIYGVVYYATTSPVDSVHRATATPFCVRWWRRVTPVRRYCPSSMLRP
ncbi:MAG: hypothetical protein HC812_14110 [Leptolyngbya sp. RL_3_1]|nr:hypothetical protein [Leptolyngbya sp. RL_3_1]